MLSNEIKSLLMIFKTYKHLDKNAHCFEFLSHWWCNYIFYAWDPLSKPLSGPDQAFC